MNISQESSRNGSVIHIMGRSAATHRRNHEVIRDYKPYFWIEDIEDIPSTEYASLDGIPVKKCFVKNPWDIKDVKEIYNHFEADIPYSSRYMLDTATLPLEDDYLRILHIDIETMTRSGDPFPEAEVAPDPICLICVYDTLTEEYYTFDSEDEYELLKGFARFVRESNPDVITGWNAENFDFPYIFNRMTQCYLNPNMLSPLDRTTYNPNYGVTVDGIDLLDLLTLYKRLHFGELESFALTAVGSYELNLEKIDLSGDLPGDMIDNGQKAELEEYCLRDVEIMVELDKKMNIIGFYHLLQRLSGLPNIASAVSNSRIHDMLILRKAHEQNIILPSKEPREKTEVVGARVLDPVPGIHENVAVLDIVGMYSNIFLTTNSGYETVSRTPQPNSVEVHTDNRTLYIDQSRKSLWVEVLEDLMVERAKYKTAMQQYAVGTPEYEFNYQNSFAMKTLIASAYGVSNFKGFRLYSNDVSDIITYVGREMNKWMESEAIKAGYECIYGDTDSVFIKGVLDAKEALNLETLINETWDDMLKHLEIEVDSHTFSLEFDAYYDRIFFTEAKKRYAGHYTFKNGAEADGTKISGFQLKRSDSTHLTKQLQAEIFDVILTDPIDTVSHTVKGLVNTAIADLITMDYLDIGTPKALRKAPESYGIQTLVTKAVIYSMKHLNMGGYAQVKPLVFPVKRIKPESNYPDTKSIAADPSDVNQMDVIRKNFDLDFKVIEQKIVKKPLENVLTALGIEYADITTGTKQTSLFGF